MKSAIGCTLVVLAATMLGCGPDTSHLPKTVPASGVVTLDGAPVENASVTFIADTGNYHATAVSDASGEFTLRAFSEKEGAVPGSYKVEVSKTVVTGQDAGTDGEASVNVQYGLPVKYSTAATSELKRSIPEEGTSSLTLELQSK